MRARMAARGGMLGFDTFTRASVGSAESGQAYTAAGTYNILSNQLAVTNPGTNHVCTIDVGASDVLVQAKLFPITGTMVGVLARSDGSSFYFADVNASGQIRLMKRASSTNTQIGSTYTPSPAFAAGDTLALKVQGTSLTVYMNDVSIITATDATLSSGNRVGFRNHTSITIVQTVMADDLKVWAAA